MNIIIIFFFFKQKTAYEMRISDWSSDVCSSDLQLRVGGAARDVRDVTAGRECAAGTGDDDHVGMPIGMRELDDVCELLVHVVVAGVEQFGKMEGEGQAPDLAGQQQRAVLRDGYGIGGGHGSPRRRAVSMRG